MTRARIVTRLRSCAAHWYAVVYNWRHKENSNT